MSNWTAETLLGHARGFIESRIIISAAELDIFTHLKSPKSVEELAAALSLEKRGTEILLNAVAAIGLLEKKDERYYCTPDMYRLLSSDAPESVRLMLLHSGSMWSRWSNLSEVIRTGKQDMTPSGLFENAELRAFIFAMHVAGRDLAASIARCAKGEASKKLLDVGGATGSYAEAFLNEYPEMSATIFDRAPVIAMAKERLADSPVLSRISFASGDFYCDPLPGGHDLVLLSAIIHQNSFEQNVDLFKKCYDALIPGGRILIRDHVLTPDKISPPAGALFAVNMLVSTDGGNCYTFAEIQAALEKAGFTHAALLQEGSKMDGVVEGFKA
jgi:predicted O-methyltransferase YrrM